MSMKSSLPNCSEHTFHLCVLQLYNSHEMLPTGWSAMTDHRLNESTERLFWLTLLGCRPWLPLTIGIYHDDDASSNEQISKDCSHNEGTVYVIAVFTHWGMKISYIIKLLKLTNFVRITLLGTKPGCIKSNNSTKNHSVQRWLWNHVLINRSDMSTS